jgi:hypothetical protein
MLNFLPFFSTSSKDKSMLYAFVLAFASLLIADWLANA